MGRRGNVTQFGESTKTMDFRMVGLETWKKVALSEVLRQLIKKLLGALSKGRHAPTANANVGDSD